MVDITEMIESKYLRKEDIEDDIVVTIKGIAKEELPGNPKPQWVCAFKELDKGLVLNKTTKTVLWQAFGRNSDQWLNQKVALYVDPNVLYLGQIVGGIRLRPIKAKTTAVKKPPPEDFNDEIPAQ